MVHGQIGRWKGSSAKVTKSLRQLVLPPAALPQRPGLFTFPAGYFVGDIGIEDVHFPVPSFKG
jgi:hypothetical protein